MQAILQISPSKYIYEFQQEFNRVFPFLRLEFYKRSRSEAVTSAKQLIAKTILFREVGIKQPEDLEVSDDMSVATLEKTLLEKFGLLAQVERQSGNVWLGTSMTNDWTLLQQNEQGRELSTSLRTGGRGAQDFLNKLNWCDQ